MTLRMPGDLTTRKTLDNQLPGTVNQWLALDNVLVKYLTPRSLKLKVTAPNGVDEDTFEACVERLLPNLFGKKMLEMAQIV